MNLRKFLMRTKMTQADVAERMGIAKITVAQYSVGKINPRFNDIGKWVDLGLTIDELFSDELAEKMMRNNLNQSQTPNDENPNIIPITSKLNVNMNNMVKETLEKILREKLDG